MLRETIPTTDNPAVSAELQQAFLRGYLHCWALEAPHGDNLQIAGVCVTTVMEDPFAHARNLVVYGLYVGSVIPIEAWKSLQEPLLEFARASECTHIYAETTNVRVQQIAEAMGFVVSTALRRRVE